MNEAERKARRLARRRPRYRGPERRKDRNRYARWAFVAWAIGVSVVVIWTAKESRARLAEGRQAHDALCVFKLDLQRRAADLAAFLQEHPAGIAGIPRATLTTSLANQVSTIRSLDRLRCPDVKPTPSKLPTPTSTSTTP